MNTHQQQELVEILGYKDAPVADLLQQHTTRRNELIDRQARNLSVHVAQRLQKKRPTRGYILAGIATSAAAALVVFALSSTTPSTSIDTYATPTVATVTTQPTQVPTPEEKEAGVAASTSSGRRAVRTIAPSEERILEQEAEQQVVEFLASALVDEDTWSVNSQDIDLLLQENGNDSGL